MTVSGKDAEVVDALLAYAAGLEAATSLPVAYPEVEFTPPADGKYLELSVFPNRPLAEGLARGVRIDQGLLQVTVVWPKNDALIRPLEKVAAVKGHYAKGQPMTSGGTTVKVAREPWHTSPMSEADKVRIPVTIPWTA